MSIPRIAFALGSIDEELISGAIRYGRGETRRSRSSNTADEGGVVMGNENRNSTKLFGMRRSTALLLGMLLLIVLIGGAVAFTTSFAPKHEDGKVHMGSLFDHVLIGKDGVGIRGLSAGMTPEQVQEVYQLIDEELTVLERSAPGAGGKIYALHGNVVFREAEDYPATIYFTFDAQDESLSLTRVMIGIHYVGADWKTAHDSAMSLLEKLDRVAKPISFEAYMQNGDYKGIVYSESGNALDDLSELDTSYTRQYNYIGTDGNAGFAVSMSYQDLSGSDTTDGLGQDVDKLFGFSITIPIRE